MTICIAGIADERYVIMAADRTITLNLVPMEFGHGHGSKLYELTPGVILGAAGAPVYLPELMAELRRLGSRKSNGDWVDMASDAMTNLRRLKIEQQILRRYGWDYKTYEKHYASGNLLEAHARKILEEMDKYHLCVHLVSGTVKKRRGSVHGIEDPGVVDCFDAIGYAATGSGETYAMQSLVRSDYTSSTPLKEAIYHVFEAKKAAEQATGVGRRTDIRVVVSEKRNIQLSDEQIAGLGQIYERRVNGTGKLRGRILSETEKWLPSQLRKLS